MRVVVHRGQWMRMFAFKYLSASVCVLWLAGCSALINVDDKQCNTNSECVSAKLGDRCVQHVCVESRAMNEPDAGDLPSDGTCETDKHCGGGSDTPRCMHGTCVTDELAER